MSAPLPSDMNQSASLGGRDKPTTRIASPPFNDPKADLIIRSSDNVHFYVHKSLLSIVSPAFEGMFGASQESYDNRPCLPFSDDSCHLSRFLSWCDPRSIMMERSPTLDNLTMTLEMAEKYKADSIFKRAHKDLSAHDSVESDPLRAFAIAIRFRLDNVAKRAARATLQVPLAGHSPIQLKHISAFALQNLHNYHFEFKKTVRTFLASDSWADVMKSAANHLMGEANSHSTHGPEYFSLKRLVIMEGDVLWLPTGSTATWWFQYVAIMMHMLNERPSSVPGPTAGSVQKLISLDKCNRCKKNGYARLDTVSDYFAHKIGEVVSKIPFEVKY